MGNPLTHSTVTGFQKTSDGTAHQAQLDDDLNLKVNVVVGGGGGGGGGPLLIPSVGNTTTTPLTAGATFTGVYEDVTHYATLVINCYSDVGGLNESLQVNWSADGVNTDEVVFLNGGTKGFTGEIGYPINLPIGAKFVRILFTNQLGVGHGTFRLTTYYSTASVASNPLINLDTAPDTYKTGRMGPVPIVQAMLAGVNPSSGTIVPISANPTTEALMTQDNQLVALTNLTQQTKITDGITSGTIKPASTVAVATDTALVVVQRDSLPAGTNVIGHVIHDTGSTTAVTGTVTVDGSGVTQPISAVALPLPTGAATNATLAALQVAIASTTSGEKGTLTLGASSLSAPVYLTGTSNPLSTDLNGGLRITGTVTANAGSNLNTSALALDATLTGRTAKVQITDGTRDGTVKAASTLPALTDTAVVTTQRDPLPAGTNVIGHVIHDTGSTTAVTGTVTVAGTVTTTPPSNASTNIAQVGGSTITIGQQLAAASIPVILPAATVTTLTPLSSVTVTQATGTNLHVVLDTTSTTAVTQATAANLNATVTQLALTKGTQGATGVSVQHLHDAGRNTRIFMLDTITAAPVAEALATVVQWYGNAAVAGTTTPAVVPAGKTLRLTGYKIQYQSLATVGYAVVRIRVNTAGVAVLASPLVASFESGTNSGATTAAVTGAVTVETGSFPEGLEIPAAAGIGFTVAGYGPTGTLTLEGGVRFEVHGYEY